jgi:hypothetical protein
VHGASTATKPLVPPSTYGVARFAPSAWVSEAEFQRLRAHPAFPGTVATFASSLIDTYSGSALLNLLMADRGRLLIGLFVLYLDVLPLPGSDRRGATLHAVQELCRRTGLCSPGRAASVLAAMRFGRYIVPRTDPEDGRRRLLVPTPVLIRAQLDNWVRQFEAMAPLFPTAVAVLPQLEQPGFRTAFLRALGTHFLAGFRVLDHVPVLTPLADSNACLLMLSNLALQQLAGMERDAGKFAAMVPLSVSALSRRFRVSRAHVRNLLVDAEQAGLIEQAPRTEGIVALLPLVEALLQFYGVLFILFDRCAAAARHESASLSRHPDPIN